MSGKSLLSLVIRCKMYLSFSQQKFIYLVFSEEKEKGGGEGGKRSFYIHGIPRSSGLPSVSVRRRRTHHW